MSPSLQTLCVFCQFQDEEDYGREDVNQDEYIIVYNFRTDPSYETK